MVVMEKERARTTIGLYCSLMEEIKLRQHVISAVLEKQIVLPLRPAHELCYLQLRMVCELIAVACLVAHGDIKATQAAKLKKNWDAQEIIKRLDRLHPTFYPEPGKPVLDENGQVRIEEISDDYLTKRELLKLYGESGNVLHRGSLKNVTSNMPRKSPDFEPIAIWNSKINNLLGFHAIELITPKFEIWVTMQREEDGKVYGTLQRRRD
jgi:hypothetical protein